MGRWVIPIFFGLWWRLGVVRATGLTLFGVYAVVLLLDSQARGFDYFKYMFGRYQWIVHLAAIAALIIGLVPTRYLKRSARTVLVGTDPKAIPRWKRVAWLPFLITGLLLSTLNIYFTIKTFPLEPQGWVVVKHPTFLKDHVEWWKFEYNWFKNGESGGNPKWTKDRDRELRLPQYTTSNTHKDVLFTLLIQTVSLLFLLLAYITYKLPRRRRRPTTAAWLEPTSHSSPAP